jgi:hypothetical protein
MEQVSHLLTLFGGLFLISLIVTPLAKTLKIPRVTLLIIGYLLGARLTKRYLAQYIGGVLTASLIRPVLPWAWHWWARTLIRSGLICCYRSPSPPRSSLKSQAPY